ncbi:MAG: RtcB family protein [Nitrospirae bacterium]|nr:RtcB family protein [Candidatus Manganitrophaceae bacterium]
MLLSEKIKQVGPTVWEIDRSYKPGMQVPARIYATGKLIREMDETVIEQLTNVATLPGLLRYAYCMPDGHSGYGFPIGGVAAMDAEEGVISPGGIGFDINCGMRLVRTRLTEAEVAPKIKALVDLLYERVPAGVGSKGFVKLTPKEFKAVIAGGARWCLEQGYAWPEDLEFTEEAGCIAGADPEKISKKAIERGLGQIGTLGSGNHYLEIQVVREANIFDRKLAEGFGLFPGQVVVMFHCGSRGFGHQVATDYLQRFLDVMEPKYGIKVLDRELACAPFRSPEGRDYFAAMKCGLNMSFANRQTILHRIRECFAQVFEKKAETLGLEMIYDVAHNTAKLERYQINGKWREVLVHRKGATRAFGPGEQALPPQYRPYGQPVIIGGSMETGSYLLVGTQRAMTETFGSTAHGSGRTMSRTQARKMFRGDQLQKEMLARGIYVRSASYAGLAEEAGSSYKEIDEVIEACALAGISKPVVKFAPIGNIKG